MFESLIVNCGGNSNDGGDNFYDIRVVLPGIQYGIEILAIALDWYL